MILLPIINNMTLLVTLSVAYVFIIRFFKESSKRVQFINGLLFGAFVVFGIYNAFELHPGIIFDGRTIILSVAGLFGGPLTAFTAAVMALSYRVYIGGPGVVMGILAIFQATALGIAFHYLVKKRPVIITRLLYILMGFLVHLVLLGLIIFLPGNYRMDVLSSLALPILILYPLASFLICLLFDTQQKYVTTVQHLSESEGRFRQLFYESHMVFMVINPEDGQIIYANKRAENFYGYSSGEFQQLKIQQINTLSEKEIKLRISLAFEKLQNRFIMQHKLSNGQIRDVEVFAGPVSFSGKIYLYSIVSDITERKKTEERLRESETSYRGLFDAVKDAIYIQDSDGVFLDANEGAVKMYGYSKDEIRGQTPEFLSAPGMNDMQKLAVHLKDAFNGKEVGFEYWGKKKNGVIFPKYVRLFKAKYFGKDVIIAIGHDISQRKQAQKELEQSRFNLNTLINVSEDVIVLLDPSGVVITYNNAFQQYVKGINITEGENMFDLLPSDRLEDGFKYFKNVLETGKPISFEDYSFNKDWWVTYYPIVDQMARVDRVAVYARDITIQKKMFNLQKDLQVAERSAQMKQQFLANMSHEMRTPMNGIIGMAELLEKTKLNEEQLDYLSTIRESSHTLLALINDVLDLALFESGKIVIKPVYVATGALKERIIKLFRKTAENKGLELTVDCTADFPEHLFIDEKRLIQVFINLIGNAIKFTRKGSVEVKGERIKRNKKENVIRFTVSDTGIGIAKEDLADVFDEFSQIDGSKTRKYEGSGLGLAISKKIIAHMGGTMDVESAKGEGSRFWFEFPAESIIVSRAGEIPEKVKRSVFSPLGLNVLIVEDKIINRKVAGLILKNMGCTVDTAENGLEGVDKVMNNLYNVVLMDIQMPVMDGVTAVKAIRKAKIKQPYIIGLSAEAMKGDAEKYISKGMDDYITKPLVPDLLYQKLASLKKN